MIVKSKKLNGQEEDFHRYFERIEGYKAYIEKHKVKTVKAGEKIDVRDTEYVWCVGTVELRITSNSHKPLFYIHYEVSVATNNCLGME